MENRNPMRLSFLRRQARKLSRSNSNSERLTQLLKHHEITLVIDVGANIGQYGRELRRHGYTGRIVSFEPGRHAHSLLVQEARADLNWEVAPRMALGSRSGQAQLKVTNRSDMDSLLEVKNTTRDAFPRLSRVDQENVKVARLDVIMDRTVAPTDNDQIFLKIDTQGYEYHVLDGLGSVLERIAGLQIEMSLLPLYEGESDYLSLLNYIHSKGFAPHLVIPGFFSRFLARQLQIDAVFFRNSYH